ncbi:LEAF RUST DISEASE-RESISTANCE LOCUS RECEPTOR PROTEIN KINASE [Salix suchowensis]|nr:LEAF RUST DISEASE-RESISTANCE LOCUS RECEPTOR PROTEIN KINASE [Salix suchowensis]
MLEQFSGAYSALLFLVILVGHHCCSATNNCAPSSCGDIPHIIYPFRLQTDPINCGLKEYELGCENNRTTVYLEGVKYYVQAIDYDPGFTIRLVEADFRKDDCLSIPRSSVQGGRAFHYGHYYPYSFISYSFSLTFISCPSPIPSPAFYFVNTSSCNNGSVYSYVMAGVYVEIAELPDLCRIDLIYAAPSVSQLQNITNMSLIEVHDILAYGFELSWEQVACYAKENHLNLDNYNYNYCALIRKNHSKNRKQLQLIYRTLLFLCGLPCLITLLVYNWRRRHLSMYDNIEEFLQSDDHNLIPIRYSYSEIKKITNGFRDKLGEGGYGSVYKGKLRSGRFAAVKLLRQEKTKGQDFINEVATIGRIHHCNVVQLIGFTAEGSKRALVYEFMPNGSLERYIFSKQGSIPLSNHKLYEISLGVARGIEYLHQGCEMQILHFDIKPHNILLDENFTPKVSDFGLAKLYPAKNSTVPLTMARGTMGYMAPELFYKSIGGVSYKADVYSFGMLLMEMVGRRKNLNASADHSSQMYFPSWIYDQVSEGKDILEDEATEQEKITTKKMTIVALWCIQLKPIDRPSMHKVVQMLVADIESLQMPPKPFLIPQQTSNDDRINMADPASLRDPSNDCSIDSSYQFGR